MNIKEVIKEIKAMPEMKGFKFSKENVSSESASAFLNVEPRNYRDSHSKDQYKLDGHYHLFIAHMYKGEKGKEFFYITICRKGEVKPYRHRNSFTIEYNKIYSSGNTVKKLMDSLNGYFKKCNFTFK